MIHPRGGASSYWLRGRCWPPGWSCSLISQRGRIGEFDVGFLRGADQQVKGA